MPFRQRLWQLPRLIVCLIVGHDWRQPIAIHTAQGSYTVTGCGRCGRNTVHAAWKPNRAMRRRIARAAR